MVNCFWYFIKIDLSGNKIKVEFSLYLDCAPLVVLQPSRRHLLYFDCLENSPCQIVCVIFFLSSGHIWLQWGRNGRWQHPNPLNKTTNRSWVVLHQFVTLGSYVMGKPNRIKIVGFFSFFFILFCSLEWHCLIELLRWWKSVLFNMETTSQCGSWALEMWLVWRNCILTFNFNTLKFK